MQAKFKINWQDGQPVNIQDYEYGFWGAEPLNYEMPDNKALVIIEADEETIKAMKSDNNFEWIEDIAT